MTPLKDRIKTALDESRMLILGSQVLVGFHYRAVFEQSYQKLPASSQTIKLGALVIMLLVTALLMSPGPYHRIVHNGEDHEDVHNFATRVMDVALLPFAVVLALDIYVVTAFVTGQEVAMVVGVIIFLAASLFWYGVSFWRKQRRGAKQKDGEGMKDQNNESRTKIKDKIEQVLTEARVVLPGVQALLGFQLATVLMQSFETLPLSSKYVHLISLCLLALSMIFLMSPAAFHRIVEDGEDTERLHNFSSTMLLAAMVPLPLGISGDFFVVVKKVTESNTSAIAGATAILIFFYALWFGYTIYRKQKLRESGAS
jgi:DMSO reductase anchor subunit